MNGSNGLIDSLRSEFQDKQYRHVFINDFLDSAIAAQLKALREQRGWTQAELARRAGMKQSRISLMENVNYSSWSVNTLRKLAEAFDVALAVRFQPFGRTVVDIELFGPDSLEVESFADDPIFGASRDERLIYAATSDDVRSSRTVSLPPNVNLQSVGGSLAVQLQQDDDIVGAPVFLLGTGAGG